MDTYRSGLLGVAGLFAADERITREAFRRAVLAMELDENFPAATGLGYIRRVPLGETDAFLEAVRADATPDFQIRTLPDAGPAPTPDRLVIKYVEPRERNAQAVGLDIGTHPQRRAAAERADRTGDLQMTAPITLVQAADRGPGLLAIIPVEPAVGNPEQAPEAGWVYAALLPRVLFADLGDGPLAELSAQLVATGPSGEAVILSGDQAPGVGGDGAEDPLRTPLHVGGRSWTLTTTPTPAFQRASLFAAWLVKAAGLAAAMLTLALFRVPAVERRRGKREGRRLAAEMTRDLREAVKTDPLTGLLNRAGVEDAIQRAVATAALRPDRHHALLFLDFDHFKDVNDTRGHAAGDELLRRISGRILAELRSDDAAGLARRGRRRARPTARPTARRADDAPGLSLPARLGGDEFVVLLRDLHRPEEAEEVAHRLLARLSEPYALSDGGEPATSTPSIGVAVAREDLPDATSLLAAADAAMYEAKHAGRACVRVHGPATAAVADRLAGTHTGRTPACAAASAAA